MFEEALHDLSFNGESIGRLRIHSAEQLLSILPSVMYWDCYSTSDIEHAVRHHELLSTPHNGTFAVLASKDEHVGYSIRLTATPSGHKTKYCSWLNIYEDHDA